MICATIDVHQDLTLVIKWLQTSPDRYSWSLGKLSQIFIKIFFGKGLTRPIFKFELWDLKGGNYHKLSFKQLFEKVCPYQYRSNIFLLSLLAWGGYADQIWSLFKCANVFAIERGKPFQIMVLMNICDSLDL